MWKPFIRVICTTTIVAGIAMCLWAIAGGISAADVPSIKDIPVNTGILFFTRAVIGGGLLVFGFTFFNFDPDRYSKPARFREPTKMEPEARYYRALGRENNG